MLDRLTDGFRRLIEGNRSGFVHFGPYSVPVKDYQKTLLTTPISDNDFNLQIARRRGVEPLSIQQIISSLPKKNIPDTVLFDTPPSSFGGNHFRILEIDKEGGFATLQLCGIFGNYDEDVPSFKVELDVPMFTGAAVHRYQVNGAVIDLQEAIRLTRSGNYPDHTNETVYWSSENGTLQPRAPKTS